MALLESIHSPADVRALPGEQLPRLAEEIRQRIISVVSAGGGHLASNLGVTELTIALHRCFDFTQDRLLWDVGHQCYPHKLLTGRADRFETIRKAGGTVRWCPSVQACRGGSTASPTQVASPRAPRYSRWPTKLATYTCQRTLGTPGHVAPTVFQPRAMFLLFERARNLPARSVNLRYSSLLGSNSVRLIELYCRRFGM